MNFINTALFFIKRCRGNELQIRIISKGKNVNKLWQKLSNMSINIGLDLKARLVWEKKKHVTISEISSALVQCPLKCGVALFCKWTGIFADFRFVMFTQILMKKLARIFNHVRKIFNCRVSYKCCGQCDSQLLRRTFAHNFD